MFAGNIELAIGTQAPARAPRVRRAAVERRRAQTLLEPRSEHTFAYPAMNTQESA